MKQGFVHVYTGDGKGKTTAALGLCLRAAGAGLKVYFCQFLKMSDFSEITAVRKHLRAITVRQFGTGSFVREKPSAQEAAEAARGFIELTEALLSCRYDLVVADELNVAVDLGLISVNDMMILLEARPATVEFVITGRKAHPSLLRKADLVTEMRKRKHYYDKGIPGRLGIEL